MLVCRNAVWFGFLDLCWTDYLESRVMDIQKEREAYEAVTNIYHCIYNADLNYYFSGSKFVGNKAEIEVNAGWKAWQAKAQAVPKWVSVEDRLPPCDFEFCETGEHVSNVVLIHSATTCGFNMGMGHVNEDGVWNAYSGEHDFMNVLMVTHWMPLPDAPQEPAND